jgi:hypothetical protein
VTALAAAELGPYLAERQVELVVDRDDLLRHDLVEVGQHPDRATGQVHVRHWLGDDESRRVDAHTEPALAHLGDGTAMPAHLHLGPVGEQVGDVEPHVVPVVRVLLAGVTEPDDQPHGSAFPTLI